MFDTSIQEVTTCIDWYDIAFNGQFSYLLFNKIRYWSEIKCHLLSHKDSLNRLVTDIAVSLIFWYHTHSFQHRYSLLWLFNHLDLGLITKERASGVYNHSSLTIYVFWIFYTNVTCYSFFRRNFWIILAWTESFQIRQRSILDVFDCLLRRASDYVNVFGLVQKFYQKNTWSRNSVFI